MAFTRAHKKLTVYYDQAGDSHRSCQFKSICYCGKKKLESNEPVDSVPRFPFRQLESILQSYGIVHFIHSEGLEMMKVLCGTLLFPFFIAATLMVGGCNKKSNTTGAPANSSSGPGKAGPGPDGAPPEKAGPIAAIMVKLSRGPESLTMVIGEELRVDPPPWDKLQPQTKEVAQLTASLGKHEPPKGSKESWAKNTAAYSDSAVALDKAVGDKDKAAAIAAHKAMFSACMVCHREHRTGMPGFFGKFGPQGKDNEK
jgi:hypothetical protein